MADDTETAKISKRATAAAARAHEDRVTAIVNAIVASCDKAVARVCDDWRRTHGPSSDDDIADAEQEAYRAFAMRCTASRLRRAAASNEAQAAEWKRLADEIDAQDGEVEESAPAEPSQPTP